jgi:L-cysteine desulfidase
MGVTIPGTTVCGVPLAAAIGAFGGDPIRDYKRWKISLRDTLKWRSADRQ